MSKVLFLGIPSHGHVNPTIGLVSELIKQGEEITYFSSEEFKEKIEKTGATFKCYREDLNIFKMKKDSGSKEKPGTGLFGVASRILERSDVIIGDILEQTKETKFDYLIYSAAFPFANILAQILDIPTVSSLAVFAGLDRFFTSDNEANDNRFKMSDEFTENYKEIIKKLNRVYSVKVPDNILNLLFNKGDINLVYTSKYFASDLDYFDDTFKFVGPPVYDRKENVDFPFEKLEGKKVVYISLGTVFGGYDIEVYNIFFQSFKDMDAIIVMTAFNVDTSQFDIPDNFIVRNYVPQSEVLKYTDAAITHAGMNSISDLIYNNVPFVALPMGADQPYLAKRAEDLGAAISLDIKSITPELLRASIEKVLNDWTYIENIRKISDSFEKAGGYKKAVEEIYKMKKERLIS
ncbi:glycosyl transferase [Clostridium sp. YIM B02505]|uniref:Glycosyl transferase n=1 Tax=Clostridium yunnanense TaxID=2800325 RepID=A0ABS1EPI1_9CLOT|nr:macrolide family glycosyltransferase [Clostridium yunnanense]MBK1811262.1 glycosyl transferase [Clostridium yunnanense]